MRTLTASDRSALIKLASSLPSGSSERKAILAGLQGSSSKTASGVNIPGVHVLDNAIVQDNAKVYGKANVRDDAKVYDNAEVYDYATVTGYAEVSGEAKVYGFALLSGNAEVSGNAKVYDNAHVCDNALIGGTAEILGGIWKGYEGLITSGRWKGPGIPA